MSKNISEAVAHMQQLIELGCAYTQAMQEAAFAFACCPFALSEAYAVTFP